MNLRVRSVTGASRSAMFASCTFSLAKTLYIKKCTGQQTESVSLDVYARARSSRSICNLRVWKIRCRLVWS